MKPDKSPGPYNNHHPAENDLVENGRKRWSRFLLAGIILGLLLLVGSGVFIARSSLQKTYTRIATTATIAFENYFSKDSGGRSLGQILKNLWADAPKRPAIPAPAPLQQEDVAAGFLYTIELIDGGKIEGKVIKIGETSISVSDDKGLEIQVSKSRVARISKMPL
jgi:hypothetical protein